MFFNFFVCFFITFKESLERKWGQNCIIIGVEIVLYIYPGKNWDEGKENGADDIRASKGEFDVLSLAPGDAHVNEGDEVKERPQSGEGHVKHDVVFPCLDWRHLLKKPEFNCTFSCITCISMRNRITLHT